MNNLANLKPEKVFEFFRQISEIPRGSGNTEKIAQYCLDFANERGLKAIKDDGGNVIIYAAGSYGYENCEPVVIQGHMDMVCEKTPECKKDMTIEGLDLCTDGEYLWADGTTLGGDDGIAMAYIFALLDTEDIPHPPIEAVITRDEETGMYGADEFCADLIEGKRILNIDSEEEGIFTVSCAGGITSHCDIPLEAPSESAEYVYEITVSGLAGGHSGVDINKGRANAFKVLSNLLNNFYSFVNFRISYISGGGKMNVIPQNASIIIGTNTECFNDLEKTVNSYSEDFLKGCAADDSSAEFTVKVLDTEHLFYNKISTEKILGFLKEAPTGVICMSKSMPGMVQTSLNIGVLDIAADVLSADFLIRSNSADDKKEVMKTVTAFIEKFNGKNEFSADYPAWEYREISPLRDLMVETYVELYGKEPTISAIHAGLECGIFSKKIKDADIISFGPDIENIHTPAERINIASVERTWNLLITFLKKCK